MLLWLFIERVGSFSLSGELQFKWRLARMQRTKPFKLLKRDVNALQIPLWLMQKGSYQNTLSLGGC